MPEQGSGEIRSVETVLESTLDSVDTAETETLKVAEEIGFEEDDLHKIGMAVRESMVNAVVHGNRYSADKKVRVSVTSNGRRFMVRIEDQGVGFDLNSIPDPLAQENILRQSGRGIFLIRAF